MNLSDIKLQYEQDSKLDDTNLDYESSRIPQLHSKYMNFLVQEQLTIKELEFRYAMTKRKKWEYYTGKMSREELERNGWEPFELTVLKQDLGLYMDSDEDLQKIQMKLELHRVTVDFLERVLKELGNRHWKIRNSIEWKKFSNGVV